MNSASLDFPHRLNRLFETITKPDGTPYTEQELVNASGGILSLRQLRRLRSSQSANPSLRMVKAIADFFQVDVEYLTASAGYSFTEITSWPVDGLAKEIAIRSIQLNDDGKQQILHLIETILADGKQSTEDNDQDQDNQSEGGA